MIQKKLKLIMPKNPKCQPLGLKGIFLFPGKQEHVSPVLSTETLKNQSTNKKTKKCPVKKLKDFGLKTLSHIQKHTEYER